MDPWIERAAAEIAQRAVREIEALVGVSSPSGDARGAEECFAICAALAPDDAVVERVPCSSPEHAPDLIARVRGDGAGRVLLLGHVDTVIGHERHRPVERAGEQLVGSGTLDMKGGVILAIGVLRALSERRDLFAELALLLVCDEEWRTQPFAHAARFAGYDACLCFEAGERREQREAVVVRRKAAGTIRVRAHGRSAHSGSAPDDGRNALLALAAAAQAVAAAHDPSGPAQLTAVPTMLDCGDAINVVPAYGELFCDARADDLDAIEALLARIPSELDGVRLERELIRRWPGLRAEAAAAPLLERAAALLDEPLAASARGGASDASHFAATIPVTVDGLGPRGGLAHNPDEFVLEDSLLPRAQVALALALAALA